MSNGDCKSISCPMQHYFGQIFVIQKIILMHLKWGNAQQTLANEWVKSTEISIMSEKIAHHILHFGIS